MKAGSPPPAYDLSRFFRGFVCTRPLRLNGPHYTFSLEAGAQPDTPQTATMNVRPERLYLDLDTYIRQVQAHLRHLSDDQRELLRVIPGSFIQRLDILPTVLGRLYAQGASPPPLLAQLQRLRQQHPHQHHFRFCILGADGGLGDTLLKATAYRRLAQVLDSVFPSFALDFVSLPVSVPEKCDLLRAVPGFQQAIIAPVTVADLAAYDGVFNLAGILSHPRWNRMPFVDFILWWLGMAPEAVPAAQKRNRLVVSRAAWVTMRQRLAALPPGRRIVFNHRATARVRSFPEAVASTFVRALAEAHPDVQFIVTDPLAISHPRITVWDDLPDYHHLTALLGQVDGLIGVDSFASHAADAFDLPTVTLSSTIPIETVYPWYPWQASLLLPGAEQLPSWGRAVESETHWEEEAPLYEAAWRKLSPALVWQVLERKMQEKSRVAGTGAPRIDWLEHLPAPPGPLVRRGRHWRHRYERHTPRWRSLTAQLAQWVKEMLHPGERGIWVTPGSVESVRLAAEQTGIQGRQLIFEPRALYRMLQRRQLEESGQPVWRILDWIPAEAARSIRVPALAPLRQMSPEKWGNLSLKTTCSCRPPAAVVRQLGGVEYVVILPPADLAATLQGLMAVIRRFRPQVVWAGHDSAAAMQAARLLVPLGYTVWRRETGGFGLQVALPRKRRLARPWRRVQLVVRQASERTRYQKEQSP